MDRKIVTIIGLGLIGGSVAKALSARNSGYRVYAVEKREESIKQAVKEGTIADGSEVWTSDMDASSLVIICTPVGAAKQWLKFLAGRVAPGCIISDVGSTKAEMTEFADSLEGDFCFVGAHPMSGSEKSGYAAAREGLFENTYYVLTPSVKSAPWAVEDMTAFAKRLGAIPVEMSALAHDRAVAAVSHVPHILSAAMIHTADRMDEQNPIYHLAAGGFRDVTRIAASDPVMWRDICLANKEQISKVTKILIEQLATFQKELEGGSAEQLQDFFAEAKQSRDRLPQKAVALMPRTFELVLDIPDRVGVIAEIAAVLGKAQINMKNIYVANSREFYGGVLVISLDSGADLRKAELSLSQAGFEIRGIG